MKNLTIKSMAEKVMRRAAAGQSFSRGSSVGHPWVVRGSSIIRFAAMFLMLMTMSIGQVWATYYYRGNQNGWGATAMTVSEDGYYEYIQQSSNTNQFKIATSTSGWDYNYSYVSKNFNGTDVSNIGDYSKDNAYCWQSGTYYILVYKPNTTINSSSNPKICASTFLPNDAPTPVCEAPTCNWTVQPTNGTVGGDCTASVSTNYAAGLTWSSSNTEVATITGSGTSVTINYLKKGSATITARVAGDGETICAGPATQTKNITVSNPKFTFTNGSTWYFDFTAVSSGANWPIADGTGGYDANAGGNVKETTFSKDVEVALGEGWGSLKTATGGWTSIKLPEVAPAVGQNCLIVLRDGKTATWGTYASAATYTLTMKNAAGSSTIGTATVTYQGGMSPATFTNHDDRGAGYTFKGYYTAQWGGGKKIINADGTLVTTADGYVSDGKWVYEGDVTLYSGWDANIFTITFDNQGATTAGTTSLQVTYNTNTNLTSAISVPAKTGYTFGGYYTVADGAGSQIFAANGSVIADVTNYVTGGQWVKAENSTLYAKWTENKYTVTLTNATEASVEAGVTPVAITANEPATGKRFSGWTTTGGATVTNPSEKSTTVTATATGTATANYEDDVCTLQYAEGEGTSYEGDMSSTMPMSYDSDENAYFVDVTTTNKSFYFRFNKESEKAVYASDWNTYPNGTRVEANGAKVNANKDVSGWTNKSICYYKANEAGHTIRIWFDYANKQTWITEAIVTYTITINNGDHGTVAPNGNQEVGSSGLDLTVTPESGYIFNGWNTTGGASMDGNHLTATADGTVTATYREAGSTKIYFYNDKDWATVKVHKYNGSLPNTVWPGVDADLETLTHDGHKVYSVTITEGEYANVIFNNNSGKQTSGIEVSAYTDAKPATRYLGPDQQWEWIALPTQNYKIVYGSKIRVTGNPESGSYVDEGTELTFTVAAPDAGYTFAGFFSDGDKTQEITDAGVDIENRTYTVTLNSNIEVHAKYTDILYTVSVSAGEHGSVSPASVNAGAVTKPEITATPDSHYAFDAWTVDGGADVANRSAASTTVTASADGTVTASFKPSWDLRGFGDDWTTENAKKFTNWSDDEATVEVELTKGNHTFKVHHYSGTEWYGNNGTMTRQNCSNWTMKSEEGNCTITADIAGTYTFRFDATNKKLTVTYPTPQNYTITYNVNGGSEIAEHLTYTEVEATFTLPVPTRSGYWFHGWYTNEACTEGKTTEITKGTTGDKTFYAKWDPVGYYLNINLNPGGDADWQKLYFEGGTLELSLVGRKFYEFSLLKRTEDAESWFGINKDGDNVRTIENDANWNFYSGQANVQLHTTIDGKYVFAVTDGANPQIQFTYPKWGCEFSIPALVNTLQPSTVSFTPNVVNFGDVTYELYYTNDGGTNWTSCAYTGAGTYSYTNTYATAGTYQLNVVVKNGEDQVGEPFLSSEFTVVEPTLSIGVSDYPRAEQTVTVTPTVTGLQAGTYHYCWSLLDGETVQDVTFTRDGETNNWTFTAPAAGNYTLHMDVKPGDNCEAEAIISKDQPLTILGDHIVINMKRDPETLWKLQNNIYYFQGEEEAFHANAEWPGVAMTFLGKDENDYPWYTYTIEGYSAYDGGTLIFNEGATDQNASQTANIPMPQNDACYYVKANLDTEHGWTRQYELIDDCPDLTRRVLLLSGTENQYQNVTYTIKAKAIFLPGEEITYTYAVTDPDGDAVALDAQHAFYPTKAGNYTITLDARNEKGDVAHSVYVVPMIENPVTLELQSGSIALGQTITLRASRPTTFPANSVFTFTVIEPGTHSQVMFSEVTKTGEGNNKDSENYKLLSTGKYIFNVVIRDNAGNIIGAAERTETVASMKVWVKHNWDGSENNWVWKEMTYRNDGTYAYYADGENGSIYRGSGANLLMQNDTPYADSQAGDIAIQNPDDLVNVGDHAVFIYDVAAGTLMVRPANNELRVYRIKSVCSDGTYYSNTVNANGQQVSFYAQKNGSLTWQHRASTAIDAEWEDGASISALIPEDNVYTATATTLGSALSDLSVYYGGYTIYSPVVGGHASMTSFTPNPDADNEYFNNYYVLHADNGQAVATVGNEINHNLSTVLPYYELPQETNLRYAYNNKTNVFVRNYLANAVGNASFLQLYGLGTNLKKVDGETAVTKVAPVTLADQSNWVYTYDAKGVLNGNDNIMATIRATYNGMQSWILSASGLENDEDADIELLTSKISGEGTYDLRLVYDYKTNRLTAGWIPSGTMNAGEGETITQVRDILVQRVDDGQTSQFSIAKGTVVAVDKMTTEFIINKKMWDEWETTQDAQDRKTMFFWLSLPYECKLADIYGFGTGNIDWDIQRYRGDLRDKGTAGSTPWRDLHISGKMNACEGYVLAIRLKEADFKEITIDGKTTSQIRLFFPSNGKVILGTSVEATLKQYTTNKDTILQDWHAMGVPVMTSGRKLAIDAGKDDAFELAYKWTWAGGARWYEPIKLKDGDDYFNFLSGHAYMVQGHGTLTWTYDAAGSGKALNAPRRAMALTGKDIRVNLVQDNTIQDKTYVLYRHTGSRGYEIGRDLEKIENSGRSMIYSELNSRLASICLSDTDNVQIPLTVVANADGEYTLAVPYNVSDVEPVLYDAVLNTTTMLNYVDYTVQLQAGTYKNRFFLSMKETQGVVTDLGSEENQSRVVKFVDNDGRLMILRDGHLYDAQGHMVR